MINEINNDQMNVINYITKALQFDSNHIECLSIIANYYFYKYEFKKAVIYFRKIHDLIENEEFSKADNLSSIAICLLNIGEIKSSITIFLSSLEILKEIKSKNDTTDEELSINFLSDEMKILQAKIYNNLANAYRKINDFDNSLKFYLMSLNSENIFTHQICCFNLGTMLISKGDFLSGINYLEKAIKHEIHSIRNKNYLSKDYFQSLDLDKYINSKGLNYFFSNPEIKEAISLYSKGKYNNSILKLKLIYKEHGDNPIVNFFLGYNYLALLKYEKSSCFFNKLNLLSKKNNFEKFSFLHKLCIKANLILKKIPSLDQDINQSYVYDMLSFVDFAYITEIENYSDLDDQSFHNKINTDFNIYLKQSERTKRITDGIVTSYYQLSPKRIIKFKDSNGVENPKYYFNQ